MKPIKLLFFLLLCASFVPLIAQERNVQPAVREVFQVVEEMPSFPGCEEVQDKKERQQCSLDKMNAFINQRKIYPGIAKENGVEGICVVRFIVNKEGEIEEPTIVRDIGAQCGKEALRLAQMMPNWNPGKQRGIPVDVYYNMPVKFSMKEERQRANAFARLDEMPVFSGCEEKGNKKKREKCTGTKMLEFIYGNLKYPESAKNDGIQGGVVVKCKIGVDGSVQDAFVSTSLVKACDEEALRLINSMPNWTPGKAKGKPVAVDYSIPIVFKLQ